MAERSRTTRDRVKMPERSAGRAGQSPQFVSYHASRRASATRDGQGSRPPLSLGQVKQALQRKKGWLNIWSVAGMLVLLCVLYSLTLVPSARLTVTNSRGIPLLRDRQQYQRAADDILSESLLHRTKLTIDIEGITKQLQQKFPELASVTVTLPFMGHRPIIEVTTSRPAAYIKSGNEQFILNSEGRAVLSVSDIPKSVGTLNIPTIIDTSGLSVKIGKAVLTGDDVKFITTIFTQFAAKGLAIENFELPAIPAELHLRVANEPVIKCNLYTDARVIAGQYLAYRDSSAAQKTPAKEYVDVRVEGKVFIK